MTEHPINDAIFLFLWLMPQIYVILYVFSNYLWKESETQRTGCSVKIEPRCVSNSTTSKVVAITIM